MYDDMAKMEASASVGGGLTLGAVNRRPTQRERLIRVRTTYQEQIAKIDQALEIMDRNKEVEQLQDLLGSIQY